MKKRMLILGLLPPALSACLSSDPSLHEDFGASVRHNIALQTMTPDAGGEDDSATMEGEQAAQAVETHREGPQEEPPNSLIVNVGGGA